MTLSPSEKLGFLTKGATAGQETVSSNFSSSVDQSVKWIFGTQGYKVKQFSNIKDIMTVSQTEDSFDIYNTIL